MPNISPFLRKVYTNSHLDSNHPLRYNVDVFADHFCLGDYYMRKRIEGMTFDTEHPLNTLTGVNLYDCIFTGGASVLEEAREISLENCSFALCSPLWNVQNFRINDSRLGETAVSAIRYSENGKIIDSDIKGAQSLQECRNVVLHDCSIFSPEFGWSCDTIALEECNVHAESILRSSRNIKLDNVEVRGAAALQNAESVQIYNSFLHSANALQNCRNVTIVDSVLKGDLVGWNCENLTLIGCNIQGMQPLCHCRNLKLIDCVMEGSELAFEYSDVKANIVGHLNSVKNPLSGKIVADSVGQVVMDDKALESTAKVMVRA